MDHLYEEALRSYHAYKIASKLNFTIEKNTFEAMINTNDLLENILNDPELNQKEKLLAEAEEILPEAIKRIKNLKKKTIFSFSNLFY